MSLPPRPQWYHHEAKALAADEIFEDVKAWASKGGVEGNDKEFACVLVLALQEGCDGYSAGRYLEETFGWPVDGQLINILEGGYRRCKFLVTPLVHAWVMKNEVRFPAKKGQGIRARIGDAEFSAKVVDVLKREARAICEPLGTPGKHVEVLAEEVLQVVSLGSKGGPGDFPTGGTPQAAAMQDPSKKVVNG